MPSPDRRIPITVLAGQSNANTNAVAVEVFRATANAGGMMVHVAANGSALSPYATTPSGTWNAAGAGTAMGENLATLFAQLVSILDPSSPSHVPGAYLDNIIFIQGEADTYGANAASSYAANLRAFHAALTARFGTHELVLSGLSDAPQAHADFSGTRIANWDVVQQHQRDVAASSSAITFVDPDALARQNGFSQADMFRDDFLHYGDHAGFATLLGRRLAAVAIETLSSPQANAAQPQIGTQGNDTFHLFMSQFAQVLAGNGHDHTIINSTENLLVIEATMASTRIVDTSTTQPRILDLIRVEALTLGSGHDTVRLAGGVTLLDTDSGNDRIFASDQSERLRLQNGADQIRAGAGHDTVEGGQGNDRISGDAGRDWLHGGPGQDIMSGGIGGDRIIGGAGNDTLFGGTGPDSFVFSPGSGHDRLTDFDPARDHIIFQDTLPRDLTLRQSGSDVIVATSQTSIRLLHTSLEDLQIADLHFL